MDWKEYKAASKARGSLALEVFVIVSTPTGSPEFVKQNLPDHLSYQAEQEAAGVLMFAGPLSDETGDIMNGGGMILYKTESLEIAKRIAEQDPMHLSGARAFTIRRWLINEGSLQLDIKLSAQSISL
ncbi:YciI family protein [Marinomonas sp.]|nr:YciI family protein [Marinomonas sp.]MDB4838069.1 YciI family protein [Marinomonas sp.]